MHAYCKENLMPDFLQINKTNFQVLFIFIALAMTVAHTKYKNLLKKVNEELHTAAKAVYGRSLTHLYLRMN